MIAASIVFRVLVTTAVLSVVLLGEIVLAYAGWMAVYDLWLKK